MSIRAEVIADSVTPGGHRLTTVVGTCHRFVLAELNTHRLFSRNSASSRAIPTHKRIEMVKTNPAIPIEFGANQAGMQAKEEIQNTTEAEQVWLDARDAAVAHAEQMVELGVHKQVVNRLLEPFMWHTVVITSSYWQNFFEQRCSPLAQPEIRVFAEAIDYARSMSTPREVEWGEWHLPFADGDEIDADTNARIKVSVARCARTSYETHDGVISVVKDLELYDKLVTARPMHASPLEHPAMAHPRKSGVSNFHPAWMQYREHVEMRAGLRSRC